MITPLLTLLTPVYHWPLDNISLIAIDWLLFSISLILCRWYITPLMPITPYYAFFLLHYCRHWLLFAIICVIYRWRHWLYYAIAITLAFITSLPLRRATLLSQYWSSRHYYCIIVTLLFVIITIIIIFRYADYHLIHYHYHFSLSLEDISSLYYYINIITPLIYYYAFRYYYFRHLPSSFFSFHFRFH